MRYDAGTLPHDGVNIEIQRYDHAPGAIAETMPSSGVGVSGSRSLSGTTSYANRCTGMHCQP